MSQFQQEFIATAIEHYGLELETDTRAVDLAPASAAMRHQRVDAIVVTWFQRYDPAWVVKALVESLYRGRYKVKSVDNILRDWQRRGSPLYKFTPDYEREILQSLRLTTDILITLPPSAIPSPASSTQQELPVSAPLLPDSEQLNPEESAPFQHHDRSMLVTRPTSDRDANSAVESEQTVLAATSIAEDLSLISSSDRSPDRQPIDPDRSSPPIKLHLFNKLRSIVEPSTCHSEGIQNYM